MIQQWLDSLIIIAESLASQINDKELFNMDMKFSVGEKVKIRGKDIVGEVIQMEYNEMYYHEDNKHVTKRYLVKQIGSYYQYWYEEDELMGVLELSDTYAREVYDVLIDIGLMVGNYDMVKMLVEEKKKYMK